MDETPNKNENREIKRKLKGLGIVMLIITSGTSLAIPFITNLIYNAQKYYDLMSVRSNLAYHVYEIDLAAEQYINSLTIAITLEVPVIAFLLFSIWFIRSKKEKEC